MLLLICGKKNKIKKGLQIRGKWPDGDMETGKYRNRQEVEMEEARKGTS